MCIEVDIKKAYDSVNKDFIIHMMQQIVFPARLTKIVKELISSPSYSVLFNGIPNGDFQSKNGIKQGDPSSPYLFTIVMEYFTVLMDLKVSSGKFKPIFNVEPALTHLIYANDLLIFCKADCLADMTIKKIFNKMHSMLDFN